MIAIRLRQGDIVLETPWDGTIEAVNDAQRVITGGCILNDDPESNQVINLIKVDMFALHFVMDAVEMFHATIDLSLNALAIQCLLQQSLQIFTRPMQELQLLLHQPQKFLIGATLQM